jgi:hypothetical protein
MTYTKLYIPFFLNQVIIKGQFEFSNYSRRTVDISTVRCTVRTKLGISYCVYIQVLYIRRSVVSIQCIQYMRGHRKETAVVVLYVVFKTHDTEPLMNTEKAQRL